MATSFKKTIVKVYPKIGEKITTDTLYWKNLEVPVTKKEYGAITNVDFSPVEPYHFAVTNSTRVQIYSARSLQIHKTISRFKELAFSGSFRDDGKLLVAGGDEGVIRLFDVEGKSLLRVFKGHKGSVHTTKFLTSRVQLFSGSDDNTVKVWDIPSEKEIVSYSENKDQTKGKVRFIQTLLPRESTRHDITLMVESGVKPTGSDNISKILVCSAEEKNNRMIAVVTKNGVKDYVRCGVSSKASKDIILTGSYDHTVKLYDTRLGESVFSVDHGAPVESVLMFPTGGIFVSAGGNVVKVWDALAGGRLLTTLCHHHKTVTCLGFCSNYQRLMSGSLDRHVKIYDVGSYQAVHTLDYPGAVLSLGVSPDDSLVVVGTAEGLLSIQRRKTEEVIVKKKKKPVTFRYAVKGKTYVPQQGDHVVEHKKKEKLAKYDKYLKKFEYSKALDATLAMPFRWNQPEVVVSVMQELIRRGGIKAALAGREGSPLKVVIRFIARNISNPKFVSTLTDVAILLLKLYSHQQNLSSEYYELWLNLKTVVEKETAYMKMLFEVMGSMDTLFAAASPTELTNQNGESGSRDITLKPTLTAQNM